MNGTFKIGAGALDAHGAPMYLTAERPGWYVFVWRFEGDDRVSPASSRYDDAWERVRVLPPCESEKPCEPEKPETPPAPAEATTPVTARHGWRCVACLGSGRVSSGDRRHTVHRRSVASSL